MPLEITSGTVGLIGNCGADEALEFVDALSAAEMPKIDMSACTNLHPALLQALLAFKPAVSNPPTDPFLVRWILPLLAPGREAA